MLHENRHVSHIIRAKGGKKTIRKKSCLWYVFFSAELHFTNLFFADPDQIFLLLAALGSLGTYQ